MNINDEVISDVALEANASLRRDFVEQLNAIWEESQKSYPNFVGTALEKVMGKCLEYAEEYHNTNVNDLEVRMHLNEKINACLVEIKELSGPKGKEIIENSSCQTRQAQPSPYSLNQ